MSAIQRYEFELRHSLQDIQAEIPGVTAYGVTETNKTGQRVPTCTFTLKDKSPRLVAEELDVANLYVQNANDYALEVTKRLGLQDSGGCCACRR